MFIFLGILVLLAAAALAALVPEVRRDGYGRLDPPDVVDRADGPGARHA